MGTISERSEVAICNAALIAVGSSERIASLDEQTAQARLCRARYAQVRDAVLRAYPWNFAKARASLPADSTPPAFEYAYRYTLPANFGWLRTLYGNENQAYEIEGRAIVTNVPAPLQITYTALVHDPTLFDALFVEALAARLGAVICMSLTENTGRTQGLWDLYQGTLIEARKLDAQEGQAEQLPEPSWLTERV